MMRFSVLPASQLALWNGPLASLPTGWVLYGVQASGMQSVKTLAWYRDGGLEESLPADVKATLTEAALAFRPETTALPKRSTRLD